MEGLGVWRKARMPTLEVQVPLPLASHFSRDAGFRGDCLRSAASKPWVSLLVTEFTPLPTLAHLGGVP
jgi:hypothetical protein